MNYSTFDTLSNRAATAAIEKYGVRASGFGANDRIETYVGPNIRAFMTRQNLPPSDWRKLLDYNSFGSALDLIAGQTQLAIPLEL